MGLPPLKRTILGTPTNLDARMSDFGFFGGGHGGSTDGGGVARFFWGGTDGHGGIFNALKNQRGYPWKSIFC